MNKSVNIVLAATFFVCIGFIFSTVQCRAGDLSDLAKIQPKITTEAQVKALLGEPQQSKDILKTQGSGRAFKDRKDLCYELGGKQVIIRVNPKTGFVVKVLELN